MSFRGFQALQLYRINHALWTDGQERFAVLMQNWGALGYAVDIHPQARIGSSVFLDHGIGVVIGSTAVVEDEANIWHGVTLGSTLTQAGDRHPKVRRGVTIGAGATILGNIEIGEGAIVAAGSVVLRSVAPFTVVAGVPAQVVGSAKTQLDAIVRKDR
jgi:serine O-acetyltransferase